MKRINLLKNVFNKKITRLSEAIAIIFLITGNIGYGLDISEDFTNEDIIISDTEVGINITVSDLTIVNNGTIVSNNKFAIRSKVVSEINNNGVINGGARGIAFLGVGGKVINNGVIEGKQDAAIQSASGSANSIEVINNGAMKKGVVTQFGSLKLTNTGSIRGSGFYGTAFSKYLENFINSGVVLNEASKAAVINQTSGGNFKNTGVVIGRDRAVEGNFDSLINNGILSSSSANPDNTNNNGIVITTTNNGAITSIVNGIGGTVEGKEIVNGEVVNETDSFVNATALTSGSNTIINGAGVATGALVVDKDFGLTDSIINGFGTSVYIADGKNLTATNTTFNAGGTAIKGGNGNNTLEILGNSTINGDVDLGAGSDSLTLANTVLINGNLAGGADSDMLNLGTTQIAKTTESANLRIFNEISGFETIKTNGNITLFETAKVTGADNINLESGNLILRVNPTVTADGKITGHALYENSGTLTSTGGKLIVGANGLSENATLSMGGTTIDSDTGDYIAINSSILEGKLSEDGKNIELTILESIPPVDPENPNPPVDPENPNPPVITDSLLYNKLNNIYRSVITAGEVGALANTTLLDDKTFNESIGGLLTIMDQIYANTPYAYTLKSSRDSLKLFEDNMSYLTIKPNEGEMIVQGKAIYTGVKNDSKSSGNGSYGFDTGHRNYKTVTNTVGGLATFEYGISDKTSAGFVFGGNNQNIDFKGSSKIKGNSLYVGTFAKTDINNFKLMSGVGYQYTSADADRKMSNKYDSFSNGAKYDINSLNVFAEAKYVYEAEQNWTLEPKVRLSYYNVNQEEINEGYTPGQLAMKTDKVDSNTTDIEVGIDFVKSLDLDNGKLKNVLSLGVINTIGDTSKDLSANILGKGKEGDKFSVQGTELPKTSGKVAYNLELEQTNGMIYTAGVSFEFAKDYNRNVNATVGIGYKF